MPIPDPQKLKAWIRRWWQKPPNYTGRIAAILTLCLSLPMGWYYFFGYETSGHFEKDAPYFYVQVWQNKGAWLRITEDDARSILASGNVDEYHTYVLRAALIRWRYRTVAPLLWDDLMHDWQDGWWSVPSPEAWKGIIGDNDVAWLAQRRESMKQYTPEILSTRMKLERAPNQSITRLSFDPSLKTSDMGSLVRLILDKKAGETVAPISVYWGTNDSNWKGYRYRQTVVHAVEGAPAGYQRYVHDLDMSWEPSWISPGARPVFIDYTTNLKQEEVRGLIVTDSPLLSP